MHGCQIISFYPNVLIDVERMKAARLKGHNLVIQDTCYHSLMTQESLINVTCLIRRVIELFYFYYFLLSSSHSFGVPVIMCLSK